MLQFRSLSLVCLLILFVSKSGISGAQALIHSDHQDGKVKIGLLIPGPEALAAKHGAELAIREANEAGGNRTYQLVVRSTDGPWGAGSKESVSMVFEDEVVAIMGSLDGRNAHLAEQVATKTRIVFLSTWATDMTLSKAFVPWYFRCLPNDHQQAVALAQEIYHRRKLKKVACIATETYDSRYASSAFIKVAGSENMVAPREYICDPSGKQLPKILEEIEELGIEALVLFGGPELTSKILPVIKQQSMNQMIFGTLAVADGQKATCPDWKTLEGIIMVSSGHWFTAEGMAFQSAFYKTFGYQPGAAAAYAYDGINVIIGVIRKEGVDRDRIIEAFAEAHHKSGITGNIQFDDKGNRSGKSGLMTIRNGAPSIIPED